MSWGATHIHPSIISQVGNAGKAFEANALWVGLRPYYECSNWLIIWYKSNVNLERRASARKWWVAGARGSNRRWAVAPRWATLPNIATYCSLERTKWQQRRLQGKEHVAIMGETEWSTLWTGWGLGSGKQFITTFHSMNVLVRSKIWITIIVQLLYPNNTSTPNHC